MQQSRPRVTQVWSGAHIWAELDGAGVGAPLVVESAAWFAWLLAESTTHFSYGYFDREVGYMVGWMTVRAERKQRGGRYWVAYRRQRGQLRKVYLGRSSALTAISLERAARRLWGKEEHATNE